MSHSLNHANEEKAFGFIHGYEFFDYYPLMVYISPAMSFENEFTYFDMESFCRLKLECLRRPFSYGCSADDYFLPRTLNEIDDIQADEDVRELLLGGSDRLKYPSRITAKQRFHCRLRLRFALNWIATQKKYGKSEIFDDESFPAELESILTERFHSSVIHWLLGAVECDGWLF